MGIAQHPSEPPMHEVLQHLEPRIRAVFARFRIPVQDAEDVLQQTLLAYLYKRDSVHDTERWLLGTLRNRCLLYWRDRRRRLYTAVDKAILESVSSPEKCPQEHADVRRDLGRVLAQLPARCRALLELRYTAGFEAQEAARQLGYKVSSVYKVTERCLAALTRRMVACGLAKDGTND